MAKKNLSVAAKFAEVAAKKNEDEKKEKGKSKTAKKPTETKEKPEKKPSAEKPKKEAKKTEARKLGAEGEKTAEKVEKKIGQPKKYDEEVKHVSYSLPISVIEDLKILSAIHKTNQTQIILSLIKKAIEQDAAKIKAYKEFFND